MEQFDYFTTENLIAACRRITPDGDRDQWVATSGTWLWRDGMWQCFVAGEVTETRDEDSMRDCAIEHLTSYGIDSTHIAQMFS